MKYWIASALFLVFLYLCGYIVRDPQPENVQDQAYTEQYLIDHNKGE